METSRIMKFRTVILWLVVTLLIFAVLWLAVSAVFGAFLDYGTQSVSGKITYNIGTDEKILKTRKCAKSDYWFDGSPYFDFSELANLNSFRISGDEISRRFVFGNDEGDELTFYIDSREVRVNDDVCFLENPVYLVGERVLVPCSFAERFMEGVTAVAANGEITVVYQKDSISLLPDSIRPLTVTNGK